MMESFLKVCDLVKAFRSPSAKSQAPSSDPDPVLELIRSNSSSGKLGLQHPPLRCKVARCDLALDDGGSLQAVFTAVGSPRGWYRCARCGIYDDLGRGRVFSRSSSSFSSSFSSLSSSSGEQLLVCGKCEPGSPVIGIRLPATTKLPTPGQADLSGVFAPIEPFVDGFHVHELRQEVQAWMIVNGSRTVGSVSFVRCGSLTYTSTRSQLHPDLAELLQVANTKTSTRMA